MKFYKNVLLFSKSELYFKDIFKLQLSYNYEVLNYQLKITGIAHQINSSGICVYILLVAVLKLSIHKALMMGNYKFPKLKQ
jgi:hypothetical protein